MVPNLKYESSEWEACLHMAIRALTHIHTQQLALYCRTSIESVFAVLKRRSFKGTDKTTKSTNSMHSSACISQQKRARSCFKPRTVATSMKSAANHVSRKLIC